MIVSQSKNKSYCTEVSNGNAAILSDVTKEKGGSGDYLRPHELLCAGFASCLNITTRMVLERKNIKYDNVTVKVDLEKKDNVSKFIYDIDITGDISCEEKETIINIVKNCPVRKTLCSEIEFERIKSE